MELDIFIIKTRRNVSDEAITQSDRRIEQTFTHDHVQNSVQAVKCKNNN